MSSEKPGWVAATAEGGGVLRQYLQGWGSRGKLRPWLFPFNFQTVREGTLDSPWTQKLLAASFLSLPAVYEPPQSKALAC